MRTSIKLLFIVTLLSLFATGCSAPEQEKMANTDPLEWMPGDRVSVEFENSDTLWPRDIYIVIRANQNFRQSQLPLTITTERADGVGLEEHFTLRHIKPNNSQATLWEARIPYRLNAVLGSVGSYRFSFEPIGVSVEGVVAIGVKIVPAGGAK